MTGWRHGELFSLIPCTEEQRLEALDFFVKGSARQWWRSASIEFVQRQGTMYWSKFRSAFRAKYFSAAVRQKKSLELMELHQGNITIDEYQQNCVMRNIFRRLF